nr:adhesion G-protein coupled receptor D2-like [Bubalus bubalis]
MPTSVRRPCTWFPSLSSQGAVAVSTLLPTSSPGIQCFPAAVLEEAPGDHPFCAIYTSHARDLCCSSPAPPAGSRMAPWCYCLLAFLIRSLSGTPSNSPGELRNPWVTGPVAPGEVVETADEVCKFPGQRLSWWQAQKSCEQQLGHLVLPPPDELLAAQLPGPIWVEQREAPLQRPPQRRARATAALMFSERSADRVARLRMPLPALGALTACAHVQWDATSSDPAALFSLAVPTLANALQLRAFAEPGGAVHAALVVRGHHAPFRAAFRADGRWHHVCVTWEQLGGRWSLFADGRRRSGARGLGAGHPLPPGGILVLGQDQDSLGGGFSARDAFSGNLTDFHLWARALSPAQMHRARACAPPPGGLLFRWDLGALDVAPSLLPPVWVRLLCPGTACPASCCQAPPTFGSTHHLLASLPTSANRATPKSGHAFSTLPVPTWYLVIAAWRDSPRPPPPPRPPPTPRLPCSAQCWLLHSSGSHVAS